MNDITVIHWDEDMAEGTTEASELGLPPGSWPDEVRVGGQTFRRRSVETSTEGELLVVRYRGPNGTVLRVLND
jgi:hypothetical protein